MFVDRSILRAGIDQAIRSGLPLKGRVLDLGGRKTGRYSKLIRARGLEYVSAGFEGDYPLDLSSARLPFSDQSFDCALVATVRMYLDDAGAGHMYKEAFRVLKPGGTLYAGEPFLTSQEDHFEAGDLGRKTMSGARRDILNAGFSEVSFQRIGGILGLGFTVLRDLVPGKLTFLRAGLTSVGVWSDRFGEMIPYLRRRNLRYYHGYIATATKRPF